MARFNYDNQYFYLDGEKFFIHSGAMHYFRIPKEYWKDRLLKLKECGLNCVETYLAWNLHEQNEGQFNFSGELDVCEFIDIAKELGLYVIVRPGPYICAEWEAGGFPYWLKNYKTNIRTFDKIYIEKLTNYLNRVVELIKPRMVENGGNILMVQIENEYGAFGNDKNYLMYLRDYYKTNLPNCVLFTADNPWPDSLNNGTLDDTLAFGTFGADIVNNANKLKAFRPNQPVCCMELWCGWFDHWHGEHHVRDASDKVKCIETFLQNDYDFNIYMFHGGTNFGFLNGANYDLTIGYQPTVTSYDYSAFLTESGDKTPAYYKLKELLEKHNGRTEKELAVDSQKKNYGKIEFNKVAPLIDNLDNLGTLKISDKPLTFENMNQAFGYMFYTAKADGNVSLNVHDRANLIVNGKNIDTFERNIEDLFVFDVNGEFSLLVENCGRVNYGEYMFDNKGVISLNKSIGQWKNISLPMDNLASLEFVDISQEDRKHPAFYKSNFIIDDLGDTFLELNGFSKGFCVLNGHNLGRFYNVGPQMSLYVPSCYLNKGENELIVFDSDGTSKTISGNLCDKPKFINVKYEKYEQ